MELTELTSLEQRLMLEVYLYEFSSGGHPAIPEDLEGVLSVSENDLRIAYRRMALKGLIVGQNISVKGKLFVEESGLLPAERWIEVQAFREALAIAIVEALTEDGVNASINVEQLLPRLPSKPGLLEFNLEVMAERGFLSILRGNRIGLGPRLRTVVGR